MTPLLEAKRLRKSFGGVKAVQDISLAIPDKSIFAVIGPNGAGKSTMMNLLSGTYQPDSGELLFDGREMVGMPSHQRVRLGLARTFQKIRLFKQLSLLDNVLAGFHIHHKVPAWQYLIPAGAFQRDWRRTREEGMALLEFVGLADRALQRAGSLAYGQQRMLEIARTLLQDPQLIMLDEPSIGLAPKMVDTVFANVQLLRDQGKAVLMVEQNVKKALSVSDRACVMELGAVRIQDQADRLMQDERVARLYLGHR